MVTLISTMHATFCTSQGPFAHLGRTTLRWRARNIAVAMCRNECHHSKKPAYCMRVFVVAAEFVTSEIQCEEMWK